MNINKKYLKQVIYNNLKQVFTSFINLTFPFLVIFKEGKFIWGNFVQFYLYVTLVSAIIMWGNRTSLLRKFSISPKDISKDFTISLATRFFLFLFFSFLGFILFPKDISIFLIACHLGIFLSSSFEVIVIYKKEFLTNLFLEGICFLLLFVGVITYPLKMEVVDVLALFSSYQLLKGLLFLVRYRRYLKFNQFSFQRKVLIDALPFFLLTLFGILGTRIDVYILTLLSTPEQSAEYHILNNFILFLMAMAGQILIPFTKSFYRGSENFMLEIRKKTAFFGLWVLILGIPTVGLVLNLMLDIKLSFISYCLIFIGIYPTFLYCVDIMKLLKNKKDYFILIVTIMITIINASLSYLFINLGWGIEGVLLSCAIAQGFGFLAFKSYVYFIKKSIIRQFNLIIKLFVR